jgi:hypothetical protein
MKKTSYFLSLLLLGIFSCKDASNDAAEAGKLYCECMEKYGQHDWDNYVFASRVCDAELSKKNRLYRIFNIEMGGPDDKKITQVARDSMGIFMGQFMDYINYNCCYAVYQCDSTNKLGGNVKDPDASRPKKARSEIPESTNPANAKP